MTDQQTTLSPSGVEPKRRCGFVALVGLPNAGKSTLLNALVAEDLAAVSPKPQTTRFQVRGISIRDASQIVLIDTPGLMAQPQSTFERAMVRAAVDAPGEADILLVIVDVGRGKGQLDKILERLRMGFETGKAAPKLWVVLNKIDTVRKPTLLTWAATYQDKVERLFMISAEKRDGTEDLHKALADEMPEGPWHFDPDTLTTLPMRLWSSEITREVLLHKLGKEVPHQLYVETEVFEPAARRATRICQVVHVAEQGHKKIVLGKGGTMIKEISQEARQLIRARLKKRVHLFLYVRHTPLWMEKPDFFNLFGLERT